jgi:hypothetical protein
MLQNQTVWASELQLHIQHHTSIRMHIIRNKGTSRTLDMPGTHQLAWRRGSQEARGGDTVVKGAWCCAVFPFLLGFLFTKHMPHMTYESHFLSLKPKLCTYESHLSAYQSHLLSPKTYEHMSHQSHLSSSNELNWFSMNTYVNINHTCPHSRHVIWVELVLTANMCYDHMKHLASMWIQTAWPGFSGTFNGDQLMQTSSNWSLSCCLQCLHCMSS